MSEKQHNKDIDGGVDHHMAGGSSGGKCLNRHLADKPYQGNNKSCSHRWQAHLQMKSDSGLYNWPKYQKLSRKRKAIPTTCQWGPRNIKIPKKGDWDVTGDNFWRECYKPYWHEAHHIVPNSTLRTAIYDAVDQDADLELVLRKGLVDESYNLNEKKNMIMLPNDAEIADAIGLPRHRLTATTFHHGAYSSKVKTELMSILRGVVKKMVKHKKVNYNSVKTKIENLSGTLYTAIKTSKAAALDNMEESEIVSS